MKKPKSGTRQAGSRSGKKRDPLEKQSSTLQGKAARNQRNHNHWLVTLHNIEAEAKPTRGHVTVPFLYCSRDSLKCPYIPMPFSSLSFPLFFCKARPNPLIKIKIKKKKKKKNENHDLLHNLWSMKKKKMMVFFFFEKKNLWVRALIKSFTSSSRLREESSWKLLSTPTPYIITLKNPFFKKKIYLKTKRQQNNSWPLDS